MKVQKARPLSIAFITARYGNCCPLANATDPIELSRGHLDAFYVSTDEDTKKST